MDKFQRSMLEKFSKEFNVAIDVNEISRMTEDEIQLYLKQKEEELFNNLFNTKIQD